MFLGLVFQKSKEMQWVPKGAVSSHHPHRDISDRENVPVLEEQNSSMEQALNTVKHM